MSDKSNYKKAIKISQKTPFKTSDVALALSCGMTEDDILRCCKFGLGSLYSVAALMIDENYATNKKEREI